MNYLAAVPPYLAIQWRNLNVEMFERVYGQFKVAGLENEFMFIKIDNS